MVRAVVEVEGLDKTFGWRRKREALRNVSFRVESGERYSLLGADGAGKTTLLRVLATLLRPTGGDAWVDGHHVVAEAPVVRRLTAYMPEDPPHRLHETPADYLDFWGRVEGMTRRERRARIAELADLLGLQERMDTIIAETALVNQRRLQLAVALLADPPVLLFDQPLVGMDAEERKTMVDLLMEISNQGKTILLSSANLGEVATISTHFLAMAGGEAIRSLSTDDLFEVIARGRHARIFVEGGSTASDAEGALRNLSGVLETKRAGRHLILYVDPRKVDAQRVRKALTEAGVEAAGVRPGSLGLGDIFLALTTEEGS